jgi:uncharacterized protein YigE (DUF2233 family)
VNFAGRILLLCFFKYFFKSSFKARPGRRMQEMAQKFIVDGGKRHLLRETLISTDRNLLKTRTCRSCRLAFFTATTAVFCNIGIPETSTSRNWLGIDSAYAQEESRYQPVEWKLVEPGFELATYELGPTDSMLRPAVMLAKFRPSLFSFHAALASDLGSDRSDIRSLTKYWRGVAGINANFFDTSGFPLGVVVTDGRERNKLHAGGSTLSGIFVVRKGRPAILHRTEYSKSADIQCAVQAGPRLITDGSAVQLKSPDDTSRRSAIAVTQDGDVIIFATERRFPGTSLAQIQELLLHPALRIKDALNLDGGGSSQFYLQRGTGSAQDILTSGGDLIPVGLIVKRRNVSSASSARPVAKTSSLAPAPRNRSKS